MLTVDHGRISLSVLLRLMETCRRKVECQSSETVSRKAELLNRHNSLNTLNTRTNRRQK